MVPAFPRRTQCSSALKDVQGTTWEAEPWSWTCKPSELLGINALSLSSAQTVSGCFNKTTDYDRAPDFSHQYNILCFSPRLKISDFLFHSDIAL